MNSLVSFLFVAALAVACSGGDSDGGPPRSLTIDPAEFDVRIGHSQVLDVRFFDESGDEVPPPAEASTAWTAADDEIVSVDGEGRVLGLRAGSTSLTVEVGALSASARATVLRPTSLVDPTRTARATIGVEGGVVTTTQGSATYSLTVPPFALAEPVTIEMTPVDTIENLPLSGPLAAAVEFEPSGLTFLIPAELEIELPAPVDRAGLVGFTIQEEEFVLTPVRVDGDTLSLVVGHFSGAGAASGQGEESDQLASRPQGQAEQDALQALAAQFGGSSGDDSVDASEPLAQWYDTTVRPGLEAAAADSARLEGAIAEFNRWQAYASAWADGLLTGRIDQGRELMATAIKNQVDRLNEQCSDQNDWTLAREVIYWLFTASSLGVANESNGLDGQTGFAELCVQIQFVEAKLPEPMPSDTPATLDVQVGLSVGGRAPVFTPPLSVAVTGGGTATVSNREGETDSNGRFTSQVTLGQSSSFARLSITATLREVTGLQATREVRADGEISLVLEGRPAGAGDEAWTRDVEIEAGAQADLRVTLRQGNSGYAGQRVSLSVSGEGMVDATEVAVSAETGEAFATFTGPTPGPVDAAVTARFVQTGIRREDTVRITSKIECPPPTMTASLGDDTTISTDKTTGQSSAGYGSLSADASATPGEMDDLKRRWIDVRFDDYIYIIPEDTSRIGTFGRLEVTVSGNAMASYSGAADGPDGATTTVDFGAFSWAADSCNLCGGQTSETVTIAETVGFGVRLGSWWPLTGRVQAQADARLGETAQASGSLSIQSMQVIDAATGTPLPIASICTASGTTYPVQ